MFQQLGSDTLNKGRGDPGNKGYDRAKAEAEGKIYRDT
jgi:hypothetical protein